MELELFIRKIIKRTADYFYKNSLILVIIMLSIAKASFNGYFNNEKIIFSIEKIGVYNFNLGLNFTIYAILILAITKMLKKIDKMISSRDTTELDLTITVDFLFTFILYYTTNKIFSNELTPEELANVFTSTINLQIFLFTLSVLYFSIVFINLLSEKIINAYTLFSNKIPETKERITILIAVAGTIVSLVALFK